MAAPRSVTRRALRASVAATALLLTLGGCASIPQHRSASAPDTPDRPTRTSSADVYDSPSHGRPPNVVRTSRYQLVPLAPTSGQRDLLQQAVSIDVPLSLHLSVHDGLVHVLRDSGLRLCPRQARAGFFSSPLPAVHRDLGPTTLSDALQILAGPAWTLRVDYAARTVCFDQRDDAALAQASYDKSAALTSGDQ